jgi:hypothetical protein
LPYAQKWFKNKEEQKRIEYDSKKKCHPLRDGIQKRITF